MHKMTLPPISHRSFQMATSDCRKSDATSVASCGNFLKRNTNLSFLSLQCTMVTLCFLNIYYDCSNIYEKFDCLLLASCNIVAFFKLLMFRIYADNLTCTYSSAINDYLAIETKEKHTIMRQHAYMGRMIFYCVVIFGATASAGLIVAPVVTGDTSILVNVSLNKFASKYPIPSTCTLGYLNISTSLYLVIFVLHCMIITLATCAFVGNDSLFLGIILHVCGQIELLRIEFSNLGIKSKNNFNKDLVELTARHQYLLNQVQLLTDTINFVLLIQLIMSSILICVTGFQLILALKVSDGLMIAKTTMPLLTILTQLFAYSVVGDYLRTQTEEIALSIYSCNWYCFSAKLMKNIVFIIMRSQQPLSLTAGHQIVVNLETYMSILKTSFSYLSMLRVMLDT